MIITCEKCSTRFNLDDSIVKTDGTKVRCSICKHIFFAYPTVPETGQPVPTTHSDPPEQHEDTSDSAAQTDDRPAGSDLPDTDAFESDGGQFEYEQIDDTADSDLTFDDPDTDLALESDASDPSLPEEEMELTLDDDGSDPDLELDDDDLSLEDTSLTLEDSNLSLDTDDTDFDFSESSASEEDHHEELPDTDQDLKFDAPDDDTLAPSSLEMDTGDLSFEHTEITDNDDHFEAEDDFSFQSDNFEIQGDESESLIDDDDDLEIELADDDVTLLKEDDTDTVESYDAAPESIEDTTEQEIDNLEFEPVIDDTDDDMNGSDMGKDGPVTDMEDDTIESLPDDEDEFELEFDYEETLDSDEDPALSDADTSEKTDAPPMITPEDDFSEYDNVLEQETEPEDDLSQDDAADKDEKTTGSKADTPSENDLDKTIIAKAPARTKQRKKQKKSSIGAPVLILLLLFVLVAGAYVASIMTGYKIKYLSDVEIPYVTDYIEKHMPKKEPAINDMKPVINQKSVNGKFVSNATAGNLFVITGRVENQSAVAFKHIQIKGSLSTKETLEAKTKLVYCGNLIDEAMLKASNINEIESLLLVKDGKHNTNLNIKPGASVPFMVVFSDYPEEKLENFIVRVHSFEIVGQTPSN
jgi:predicted Zn finger-like uncharacterized protein